MDYPDVLKLSFENDLLEPENMHLLWTVTQWLNENGHGAALRETFDNAPYLFLEANFQEILFNKINEILVQIMLPDEWAWIYGRRLFD